MTLFEAPQGGGYLRSLSPDIKSDGGLSWCRSFLSFLKMSNMSLFLIQFFGYFWYTHLFFFDYYFLWQFFGYFWYIYFWQPSIIIFCDDFLVIFDTPIFDNLRLLICESMLGEGGWTPICGAIRGVTTLS